MVGDVGGFAWVEIAVVAACEGAGGGEEAGVAAHDDVDFDAWERDVVHEVCHAGHGDESGGGGEAWGVVVFHEVVVHGLWDVEAAEVIAILKGFFAYEAAGVGAVVATDVEEVAGVVLFAGVEDALAVGGVGFISGRAQACGGCESEAIKAILMGVGEVVKLAFG